MTHQLDVEKCREQGLIERAERAEEGRKGPTLVRLR